MNASTDQKKTSITVRASQATAEKLRLAMKISGKDQSDILRMALDLGLDELEAIGYDDMGAIKAAIRAAKDSPKAGINLLPIGTLPAGSPANVYELPFLGAVAAGEPVEAPRDELLPVAKQFPAGHFIVEVNGSSMEPDFPDGSRWIIDGKDKFTPKNGAVCVVSDGSGSYLKRWNKGKKQFESINPGFNQILPAAEARLQGYPVERYTAP